MKLTFGLIATALTCGLLHAAPPSAGPRPNLLVLVADDLGYADVGFNGGKAIATPNLDHLAATGVKLMDFRACPMCSPTRAGLLTGRWPLRFGVNFLPALHGQPLPARFWFSYVHQSEEAQASVHDGQWKLVAKGDFFSQKPAAPPKLELYDLQADPGETTDVAARHPEVVARLHTKLREFGSLEKPGSTGYDFGQEGFRAPKDWVIEH